MFTCPGRTAKHLSRRAAALSASLLLALAAGLALAGTARADSAALVTCLGTAQQSYSPALTTTTKSTRISSALDYSTCVSAEVDPPRPAVTSADIAVDYTTDASCLVAPPVTSTTVDITWSNGLHSTAAVTVVVTRTTGTTVVVSEGPITGGLFAGHLFNDTVTYPSLDLLGCLGGGIDHISGLATLTVAGL